MSNLSARKTRARVAARASSERTRPRLRRARSPRVDILERAAQLMKEKGFAGMSARDLANELEFSKANFFYHFRSKEQLLYRIFVDTLEHFIRHVEEILGRPDSAEGKFRTLIDFYAKQMFDRSAVMTVWFKERGHLSRQHANQVRQLEDRLIGMVADFYEQAIERGDFRPVNPVIARMAIFGMCFNFTRRPQLRDELTMETISEQLQQIACEGLLNRRKIFPDP